MPDVGRPNANLTAHVKRAYDNVTLIIVDGHVDGETVGFVSEVVKRTANDEPVFEPLSSGIGGYSGVQRTVDGHGLGLTEELADLNELDYEHTGAVMAVGGVAKLGDEVDEREPTISIAVIRLYFRQDGHGMMEVSCHEVVIMGSGRPLGDFRVTAVVRDVLKLSDRVKARITKLVDGSLNRKQRRATIAGQLTCGSRAGMTSSRVTGRDDNLN